MARRVVIAGASGFLGGHLAAFLAGHGHRVTRLVRRPADSEDESRWDPYAGTLDPAVIESADVVVNAAGSPLVGNPRSRRWQRELRRSRVTTTRVLAEAIAASTRRPDLLAQNAVGWYGAQPHPEVDESATSRGDALMTSVCRDWQDAATPAVEAGARVCFLRTAPVMDRRSPPLKQLRPLFRAGLGARIGTGEQRMPLISLRDWLACVAHLVEHDDLAGPVNLCCPEVPTNRDFTESLARQVHRRAVLVAPRPVLKVGTGPLAPELLGSLAPVPAKLRDAGYAFRDPDVASVLAAGLAER